MYKTKHLRNRCRCPYRCIIPTTCNYYTYQSLWWPQNQLNTSFLPNSLSFEIFPTFPSSPTTRSLTAEKHPPCPKRPRTTNLLKQLLTQPIYTWLFIPIRLLLLSLSSSLHTGVLNFWAVSKKKKNSVMDTPLKDHENGVFFTFLLTFFLNSNIALFLLFGDSSIQLHAEDENSGFYFTWFNLLWSLASCSCALSLDFLFSFLVGVWLWWWTSNNNDIASIALNCIALFWSSTSSGKLRKFQI